MGESSRSKASNQYMNDIKAFGNIIGNTNVDAGNAFRGYKNPFGYNEMATNLDKIRDLAAGNIDRDFQRNLSSANMGAAQRMASQGITGGSILNNQFSQNLGQLGAGKFNALQNLAGARMGQEQDIMNLENQNKFRTTAAAQDQDNRNIQALLQRLGLMQGTLGMQGGAVGMLDDSSGWDVAGNLLGTAVKIGLAPTTGGGSLIGDLFGKS